MVQGRVSGGVSRVDKVLQITPFGQEHLELGRPNVEYREPVLVTLCDGLLKLATSNERGDERVKARCRHKSRQVERVAAVVVDDSGVGTGCRESIHT